MSDPVDDLLADTTTQPDPPADPPSTTATIDKDELARLQQAAARFEQVAPTLQMLEQNPGLVHDLRARAVEMQAPPPRTTEDFDWSNPRAEAEKAARDVMAPAAIAMQEKFAGLAIQNFKSTLTTDPYFHVAMSIFDKKIANIPRAQLGACTDAQILGTLNEAWNAACGEYSRGVTAKRAAEAAKNPPTNLGVGSGGSGGGGPKQKRTLEELDRGAYISALNAGLSPEDMQEIADQLEGND